MIETSSNKIVYLPNDKVKAVGKGIIVKDTDKCSAESTRSGIVIPDRADTTRKYSLGEVVAIGKDVVEVAIGDLVLFQIASSCAFPLPNGIASSVLTKIDETPIAIMCVIKKDDIEEADASFRAELAK